MRSDLRRELLRATDLRTVRAPSLPPWHAMAFRDFYHRTIAESQRTRSEDVETRSKVISDHTGPVIRVTLSSEARDEQPTTRVESPGGAVSLKRVCNKNGRRQPVLLHTTRAEPDGSPRWARQLAEGSRFATRLIAVDPSGRVAAVVGVPPLARTRSAA